MAKNKNNNQPIGKTELVWPGKRKEVERVGLPFQTVETINLPRGTRQEELFGGKEDGWKNRLIWGDNLLIMGSLLKDFAGKINLIYIDPPFATGDDFSFTVNIGDQAEITKEPSALEVKAYRDTWGKGMQSYLQMMYDRLVLMKELLADDGTIYVHLGPNVSHYIKVIIDEIFGRHNFKTEIVWKRLTYKQTQVKGYGVLHDVILYYTKGESFIWNDIRASYDEVRLKKYFSWIETPEGKNIKLNQAQLESKEPIPRGRRFAVNPLINLNPDRPNLRYEFLGHVRTWKYTKGKMEEYYKKGIVFQPSSNSLPQRKQYLDESSGMKLNDIWVDISGVMGGSKENVDYPTQKPEALVERIVNVSSNEGDLVADFFCGSGTTGVVAEKLGRRWIMSDLGRFAIHTSRKRLLDIEKKDKNGNVVKQAKPFVVQNLGKYERHRWAKLNGRYKNYTKFILELYHAEPVDGFTHLHGKKAKSFVRVGAVDAPVTLSEIREALEECRENKIKRLDVLGWEWEMGLHDLVKEEAEKYGVKLSTLQIPREVMELSAADAQKHDVQFFELAYLEVEPRVSGKKVTITLKDFIIPNPELLPEEVKGKVKNWSDFTDYWAVDWMFNQHDEETEEDDTFHNMNQRYRTRKEPKLELSMDYTYQKAGKYNVLVKVIDIFGNDTTKLIEVKV